MTDSRRHAADPRRTDDLPPVLEIIPDDDDRPAAYTFVPRTAAADERTTTWITARADSVADLEHWR